jgi:hypothetical protein
MCAPAFAATTLSLVLTTAWFIRNQMRLYRKEASESNAR